MTRLLRWFRNGCLAAIVVIVAVTVLAPQRETVSSNADDRIWRTLTPVPTTTVARRLSLVGAGGLMGASIDGVRFTVG